jgi:type IV pilus assembly protein PilN
MIKINLLGEKVDHSATYAVQGALYVGSLILSLFVMFLIHDAISSERSELEDEVGNLTRRLKKLEEVTKRVSDLEQNKKSLKEKLTTIALLKKKKSGPVKVVDDLNSALPDRAWVTELTQRDGALLIRGVALDNPTIAEFISKVGDYPLFDREKVELVKSAEFLRDNVKLKEFNIIVPIVGPSLPGQTSGEVAMPDEKSGNRSRKRKGAYS